MVLTIFIIACFLAPLFWHRKRKLKEEGRETKVAYHFFVFSLEFLIPLIIVSLLYLGIFAYVSLSVTDMVTLRFLIDLEESLDTISSYFSFFKLSAIGVLIVLTLLFTLALLRLPSKTLTRLSGFFERYRTWSRRIYIVVVLLSSFTLFGAHVGAPSGQIKLRIDKIRHGYSDLHQDVKETASEEVMYQLILKTKKSFPPAYHQALNKPEEIAEAGGTLRQEYEAAKNEYEISVDKVVTVLQTPEIRLEQASALETNIKLAFAMNVSQKGSAEIHDAEKLTYEKIRKARNYISRYRQGVRSRTVNLLRIQGGKKIVLQLPKVVTGQMKTAMFEPLMEVYPISRPFIEVFTKTFDKGVEGQVEKAVDRITDSTIKNPRKFSNSVSREALLIVKQKQVIIPSATLEKANQSISRLDSVLRDIQDSRVLVQQEIGRVNDAKAAIHIVQLRSPTEQSRIAATDRLVEMGTKVNSSRIGELTSIMRSGSGTWSKYLYRESHCTWYEDMSVKYYAGDVLSRIDSPHVSEELREEARAAKENGKSRRRVMDPGWI